MVSQKVNVANLHLGQVRERVNQDKTHDDVLHYNKQS